MNSRELGREFGRAARQGRDVASLTFVYLAQGEAFDEITLCENADLFPSWDSNWTGKAGSILRDEGQLYRSIHNVGAGQNTKPSSTPSMWTLIGDPSEEWPMWVQPLGGHDAYQVGAKVNHAGNNWICNTANCVWEPGVYGWTKA